MRSEVRIGEKAVGEGRPCLVIAEAGANHDRKLDQALALIDAAAGAGADAVKFQTYRAEALYSRHTPTMSYLKEKNLDDGGKSVWQIIKDNELPREWTPRLAEYCREKGVMFLSTPFDLEAVDELVAAGVPALKIASFEITHLPLLKHAAQTGLPLILSTGMADLGDIERARDAIAGAGGDQLVLLHCAIAYPPRYEDVHLRAMDTLRQAFQVPVGFSDHTLDIAVDLAAVARGAAVIEKHFTLDRELSGPDHPFALEPDELARMCVGISQVEQALGQPLKRHTDAEAEMYRLGRRSLCAAVDIARGTVITREMIAVKRPGTGLPTQLMEVVVGRVARRDIGADEMLTWEMI